MALYQIYNGVAPGAAASVVVTTGTAIKTMLQIALGASITGKVVEWGISFDGVTASNAPIKCELVETSLAATVTTLATADIVKLDADAIAGGDPVTNLILVSTILTGFTATTENAASGTFRLFDYQLINPTASYVKQFPLGREPIIQVSKLLRVRVTAASGAVNAVTYCTIFI